MIKSREIESLPNIQYKNFLIAPWSRTVILDGEEKYLSPKEFDLLYFLQNILNGYLQKSKFMKKYTKKCYDKNR